MTSSGLTVAVVTFRRPQDVAALLPELIGQVARLRAEGDAPEPIRILVVDNDPAQSARPVVAAHDRQVAYEWEPEPGIAAARNRALDFSSESELLIFIDDDERPQEHWLTHLVRTKLNTGADAVAGRVVSVYPEETDPWIVAGGFLSRDHRRGLVTGAPVTNAATNNLLLDMGVVRGMGLRFDSAFGLTGGSDTLFTRTFVDSGGRIVWCDEAVVTDEIRLDRLNRRWMLLRALSYGSTDTRVAIRLADGFSAHWTVRVEAVIGGLARIAVGAARWLSGILVRSSGRQARGLATALRGVGMLAGVVGVSYRRYKRAPGVDIAPSASVARS